MYELARTRSLVCIHKSSVTACAKVALVKYVMNTIDTVAHTLEFNFHTVTNHQAIDALVHALTIDLFINNGVECAHPCADRLVFDSERDCTFAQLVLCSDTRYTLLRL